MRGQFVDSDHYLRFNDGFERGLYDVTGMSTSAASAVYPTAQLRINPSQPRCWFVLSNLYYVTITYVNYIIRKLQL